MFYYFIAKPGEKNKSKTITKNYYKQKLTKFVRERLEPRRRSMMNSAIAPRKLRGHVIGYGSASYKRAEPRMPVKIAPPIPLRGKEVEAKLPQRRVTYTYEPQDQEEVPYKTYEDATGSESTSYIQCKYVLVILVRKLTKTSS